MTFAVKGIANTLLLLTMSSCASPSLTPVESAAHKNTPERQDRSSISQLIKTDFDRMADVEVRENTESLRVLMLTLYKRTPHE